MERGLEIKRASGKAKGKKELEEEGEEEEEEEGEEEKRKRGDVGGGKKGSNSGSGPFCQAEKCTVDLTNARRYHRRHRVCEHHSKEAIVLVAGLCQRFCQQCSSNMNYKGKVWPSESQVLKYPNNATILCVIDERIAIIQGYLIASGTKTLAQFD